MGHSGRSLQCHRCLLPRCQRSVSIFNRTSNYRFTRYKSTLRALSYNATVVKLILDNNGLSGCLPLSLTNLTDLHTFSIVNASLHDYGCSDEFLNYESPIHTMSSLRYLNLEFSDESSSDFTIDLGLIGDNLLDLNYINIEKRGLSTLNLARTTSLSDLRHLKNLTHIRAGHNGFRSEIPRFLCNLNLIELSLSFNGHIRQLPSCFTSMTSLVYLDLSGNAFVGSIPIAYTTPSFDSLQRLDLSQNPGLTGAFPSITSLRYPSLQYLSFAGTGLSDSNLIGSAITIESPTLEVLDLTGTTIRNKKGLKPFSSTYTPNLVVLKISNTGFGGDLSLIGTLTKLEVLEAARDSFFGELSFLSNLPLLRVVHFPNNYLSGEIPEFLTSSSALYSLDLSSNQLQSFNSDQIGSIPDCFLAGNPFESCNPSPSLLHCKIYACKNIYPQTIEEGVTIVTNLNAFPNVPLTNAITIHLSPNIYTGTYVFKLFQDYPGLSIAIQGTTVPGTTFSTTFRGGSPSSRNVRFEFTGNLKSLTVANITFENYLYSVSSASFIQVQRALAVDFNHLKFSSSSRAFSMIDAYPAVSASISDIEVTNCASSAPAISIQIPDTIFQDPGSSVEALKRNPSEPHVTAANIRVNLHTTTALLVKTQGRFIVFNCSFDDNNPREYGDTGGLHYLPSSAYNSAPYFEMQRSFFRRNSGGSSNSVGGGGLLIQGRVNNLLINTTEFVNNTANSGGGLLFSQGQFSVNFVIINSRFEGNVVDRTGGAISFDTSSTFDYFFIDNCHFIQNSGLFGGAVVTPIAVKTVVVSNSFFQSNNALGKGAGLYVSVFANGENFSVNNTIFDSNSALDGGGIYWDGIFDGDAGIPMPNKRDTSKTEIPRRIKRELFGSFDFNTISFCKFTGNYAKLQGGGVSLNVYFDGIGPTIQMYANDFDNNEGVLQGGALYVGPISNPRSIQIVDNRFKFNRAISGAAAYIGAPISSFEVYISTFENNRATLNGAGIYLSYGSVQFETRMENNTFADNSALSGGAIYVASNQYYFLSYGNLYLRNQAVVSGGAVFFAEKPQTAEFFPLAYYDFNTERDVMIEGEFSENTATSGGAIFFDYTSSRGQFSVMNTKFNSNQAKISGGAISVQELDDIFLFGSPFFNNSASDGGAISIARNSEDDGYVKSFTAESCEFTQNNNGGRAGNGGAIYVQSSKISTLINITSSTATDNHSGFGGFIRLFGSFQNLTISECSFDSNVGSAEGGAISTQASFQSIKINSTTFSNGNSAVGGAISYGFVSSTTEFRVNNSKFLDNYGSSQGGALTLLGSIDYLTFTSTQFLRNKAVGGVGGAVLMQSNPNLSGSQVRLKECEFKSNSGRDGGAFFLSNSGDSSNAFALFQDDSSIWESNSAINSGGSIYIQSPIDTVSITSSSFLRNNASVGGGLFLRSPNDTLLNLETVNFESNSAVASGGALFTFGVNDVTCVDSTFNSNSAGEGGAWKMTTEEKLRNVVVGRQLNPGILILLLGNYFVSNNATTGGALVIVNPTSVLVPINMTSNRFSLNEAIFGGSIASFGDLFLDGQNFENDKATYGSALAVMTVGNVILGTNNLNNDTIWVNNGTVIITGVFGYYREKIVCADGGRLEANEASDQKTITCIYYGSGGTATGGIIKTIEEKPVNNTGLIVGLVIGLILLAIIVLIILFLIMRRRQKKREETMLEMQSSIDLSKINFDVAKNAIIDFNDVKDREQVGQGAFGVVYKATWRNAQVAQKQLLNMATIKQHELEDFLQEVSILQGLRSHPNVVLFLGITVPPQPLSLVTEFCAGGGLYTYLQKNPSISNEQKRKFISGIALGMYHLHSENIIHRDLAARNILLSSALEPKVADFGLSRTTESAETGAQTTSDVGPLKWMSPEAITNKHYSNKSDVYSFSMTMWEILAVGELYPDLTAVNAAIGVTTNGLRPVIPEGNEPQMIELMVACWQHEAENRPDFDQICKFLNNGTPLNAKEVSKKDIPEPLVSVDNKTMPRNYSAFLGKDASKSNYTSVVENPENQPVPTNYSTMVGSQDGHSNEGNYSSMVEDKASPTQTNYSSMVAQGEKPQQTTYSSVPASPQNNNYSSL